MQLDTACRFDITVHHAIHHRLLCIDVAFNMGLRQHRQLGIRAAVDIDVAHHMAFELNQVLRHDIAHHHG